MDYYISINEFQLNDIFLQPEKKIPIEILQKIKPLHPEISLKKWHKLIHPKIGGFLPLLPHITLSPPILSRFDLDNTNDENLVRQQISKMINVEENSKIIFFWNQFYSVETEWGIFLKYWTIFCSDYAEGCIIVFDLDPHVLIFSDEGLDNIFWLEERKKLFHFNS